jgi:Zn finger protein HypA/HybF involved in hydrogenase expression
MESYLSIIIRNHAQDNITEENLMAKCPKCGAEVAKPKKTWKMAGRPDKQGKRMQLEIGLYECPKCHATFREVLSKKKI